MLGKFHAAVLSAAFVAGAFTQATCAQDTAHSLDYKGYHVAFGDTSKPDVKSIERQIDICEAVKVPERMRTFFKSVPITIVQRTGSGPSGYRATPDDPTGRIVLASGELDPNKPILLHEFMHGVLARLLPEGKRNEQIAQFYQIAQRRLKRDNAPDGKPDYFLKNTGEFFAVTTSIYLFGDIKRPPYSMSNIEKHMPRYAQYLRDLFKP